MDDLEDLAHEPTPQPPRVLDSSNAVEQKPGREVRDPASVFSLCGAPWLPHGVSPSSALFGTIRFFNLRLWSKDHYRFLKRYRSECRRLPLPTQSY